MTTRKNGQFYKVVGGEFGIYWKDGRWHRFDCIGCMYAAGILNPTDRLGGPPPINLSFIPVEHRHDVALHADWLRAGKPIKRG